MTQPKAKPKTKLTGADYMRLTPPSHRGVRYQLIEGELVKMAGANEPHQVFIGELYFAARTPNAGSTGELNEIRLPPFDVYIDEHNTFQPDLLRSCPAERRTYSLNRARRTDWSAGRGGGSAFRIHAAAEDLEREAAGVFTRNGVREMRGWPTH